jgi:hypothetical protein
VSNVTPPTTDTPRPARHEIYIPGYALAKLGLALLGLALVALSMQKLAPLARLAFVGATAGAEAVRVVKTDAANSPVVYTSDADVLTAVKALEDIRDHEATFWVEYRFTTAQGKPVEVRSPLGQHVKPLQPLRDRDGLPSTITVWYDKANPHYVALPLELGTWFMPGMLLLFGALGIFMGLLLWRHANRPIQMPDLSRSHAEQDAPAPAPPTTPPPLGTKNA